MTSAPSVREAATVVLVRERAGASEVLMLRRSLDSPAFPGVWVFPGGTVTADDRDAADALRAAAVRECAEECGIVVDASQLVPLSQWSPPATARTQFRTTFFAVASDIDDDAVILDDFEVVESDWVTPSDALVRHAQGVWDFLPPTWVTLSTIVGAMPAHGQPEAEPRVFSSEVVGADPTVLAWAGDDAHSASSGSTGGRHRITLGPRPWTYERTQGGH